MTYPLNFNGNGTLHHDITDRQFDQFTIAAWIQVTPSAPAATYVAPVAMFRNTPQNSPLDGAVGVHRMGTKIGQPYFQPGLNLAVSRCPTNLMDQGLTHLAVRVNRINATQANVLHSVNGCPVHEATISYPAAITSALQVGGYHKTPASLPNGAATVKPPDEWKSGYFHDAVLTDDELSALYLSQRAALGAAVPKLAYCAMGDSRTAFTNAPLWSAARQTPGAHYMLDAWGGTFYAATGNNYAAPTRRALRQRFLKYASAHYQKVVLYCPHGINDIAGSGRAMSPNSPFGSWQNGAEVIDMMIHEDRDTVPLETRHRVELWADTIWPHGGWLAADPARAEILDSFNEWRRSGWQSQGYSRNIDMAAWAPIGYANFADCALHAFQNGGNGFVLSDGIHWALEGGASAASAKLTPAIQHAVAEI